jgi:AcrR family transcriptional regulator
MKDDVKTDRGRAGVRDPVQTRAMRTKEKIIDAGTVLFSERGYHNVTADEIARAAGLSVGTFYAYFFDKRDLFLAVLTDYFAQCDTVVAEGVTGFASIQETDESLFIIRMINLLVTIHRLAAPLLNEFLKMSLADDEVKRHLDEVDTRILTLLKGGLIRAGVDNTRAEAAAFVIYHAAEGIIHQIALGRLQIDEQAVLAEMARLFTDYLNDKK